MAAEKSSVIKAEDMKCAFCGSDGLVEVIDFGDVALAGGFLKEGSFATEPKFRLRVGFCPSCYAVQVPDKVDPDILFTDYFYFSSAIKTLREHFIDYATEVVARFLDPKHSTVVEFGCNDGILLRPLADQGVATVVGVDPALNILKTIDDPADQHGPRLLRRAARRSAYRALRQGGPGSRQQRVCAHTGHQRRHAERSRKS